MFEVDGSLYYFAFNYKNHKLRARYSQNNIFFILPSSGLLSSKGEKLLAQYFLWPNLGFDDDKHTYDTTDIYSS